MFGGSEKCLRWSRKFVMTSYFDAICTYYIILCIKKCIPFTWLFWGIEILKTKLQMYHFAILISCPRRLYRLLNHRHHRSVACGVGNRGSVAHCHNIPVKTISREMAARRKVCIGQIPPPPYEIAKLKANIKLQLLPSHHVSKYK